MYTQASHYVDMLHFFFGKAVEYKGLAGNLRGLETDDSVSSVIRFENGHAAKDLWQHCRTLQEG